MGWVSSLLGSRLCGWSARMERLDGASGWSVWMDRPPIEIGGYANEVRLRGLSLP
jgi:hypothetical protein